MLHHAQGLLFLLYCLLDLKVILHPAQLVCYEMFSVCSVCGSIQQFLRRAVVFFPFSIINFSLSITSALSAVNVS